jgi:lipopolysaccharide export system protein LptA
VRFTIERLRTLVLAAGVLLVISLVVFLGRARFHYRLNRNDLPHSLGHGIQEEANGFVYTHEVRGHTLYRIRASKQAQLKKDGKIFIQLHDVTIELYAEDGSRVDRIEGKEFEYNPGSGIAKAMGPVEITLVKPKVAPAIAPKATADHALSSRQMPSVLSSTAQKAASGEIHVRTSGLIFDRNTGEASTAEKVEFTLTQGDGSAIGARYDGHEGLLSLDHDVELSLQRGAEPVKMFAGHAEFDRDEQACSLRSATVRYGDDLSKAGEAKVYFRDDGSAQLLNASGGFSLTTTKGGRLAAPEGILSFDEHNQPVRGHLQGGVTIDSENKGREIHGNSPIMDLVFVGKGVLQSAHLEHGVQIATDQQSDVASGPVHVHREWRSPLLDIAFRSTGNGQIEPASMHGSGGVVVTGSTQRGNRPATPEKMTADEVTGDFGPHGVLKSLTGRGQTNINQMTAAGVQQSTSGDKLVVHLMPAENSEARKNAQSGMQIESATVDGHVVLVQQPPAKNGVRQPPVRATAAHAEYGDSGQWLHLTGNPWVTDGGLELTAEKLNISQESGDAFAEGDVKATWAGDPKRGNGSKSVNADFGAQGPTHVVAQHAEMRKATGAAIFKGNARLWQEGNSVAAPEIALNRTAQTLSAQTTSAKTPVQVVLVSETAAQPGAKTKTRQNGPSVITIRAGDMKYAGSERKAVMRAGVVGRVVADTAEAETSSNQIELVLLPPGDHASRNGAAGQVERITSTGHVEISSQGRHGVGEKLVYTNQSGNYVLTGTAAAPPQLIDPARGTVTGQALIFNTRDDSVSIEGEGQKTTTATTAPK